MIFLNEKGLVREVQRVARKIKWFFTL